MLHEGVVMPATFALVILGAFLLLMLVLSVKVIRPYQKGLVEKLGKFNRILEPDNTIHGKSKDNRHEGARH